MVRSLLDTGTLVGSGGLVRYLFGTVTLVGSGGFSPQEPITHLPG